jgi:hypothetical protein
METYKNYVLNTENDTPWYTRENTLFHTILDKLPAADQTGVTTEHTHAALYTGGSQVARVTGALADGALSIASGVILSNPNRVGFGSAYDLAVYSDSTTLTAAQIYSDPSTGDTTFYGSAIQVNEKLTSKTLRVSNASPSGMLGVDIKATNQGNLWVPKLLITGDPTGGRCTGIEVWSSDMTADVGKLELVSATTHMSGALRVDGTAELVGNVKVDADIYSVDWTNWGGSVSVTGFASFTTGAYWYKKVGKTMYLKVAMAGPADGTSITITTPYNIKSPNSQIYDVVKPVWTYDNSGLVATPGLCCKNAAANKLNIYADWAAADFTLGHNIAVYLDIDVQIA